MVRINTNDIGKNKEVMLEVKRRLLGRVVISRTAAVACFSDTAMPHLRSKGRAGVGRLGVKVR